MTSEEERSGSEEASVLHDKDIREPLFDFLEETFGKVRIIEEKRMGRSRADIVMVMDGALTGIEIKSDADTYARLARQVEDYNRYFDYNFLVVGSRHALHAKEHVPEEWGIISAEAEGDAVDFYLIREARRNLSADLKLQLRFLWRPELMHVQMLNHMPAYADRSKAFVIGKICQMVPPSVLKGQITNELFERDYEEELKQIKAYKADMAAKRQAAGKKRRRKKRVIRNVSSRPWPHREVKKKK